MNNCNYQMINTLIILHKYCKLLISKLYNQIETMVMIKKNVLEYWDRGFIISSHYS